ncbi:MAG: phasin family protein [Xanthobacteraceae bacterium]|jgi:phasin
MNMKTNAAPQATDLVKRSYSSALKGVQDYNNKLLEFAQTNTNTAFEFVQRLLVAKSPSEFIELSSERARKQFTALTEQTKELAALAQKVTVATNGHPKADATKTFGQTT